MDSYLLDNFAEKNGILILDNIPFDEIFAAEFNEELNKHNEFVDKILNKNKIKENIEGELENK